MAELNGEYGPIVQQIVWLTIFILFLIAVFLLIRDSQKFKEDFCSDCRVFTEECRERCECVEWDTPIMDKVDAIRGGMNRHCNMTPVLENYYQELAHTVEIHEVKVCTKALPR